MGITYDPMTNSFKCTPAIPMTFLICSESREQAKLKYQLGFAGHAFVNFQQDVIHLDFRGKSGLPAQVLNPLFALVFVHLPGLEEVQSLCLDAEAFHYHSIQDYFKIMKELRIVILESTYSVDLQDPVLSIYSEARNKLATQRFGKYYAQQKVRDDSNPLWLTGLNPPRLPLIPIVNGLIEGTGVGSGGLGSGGSSEGRGPPPSPAWTLLLKLGF